MSITFETQEDFEEAVIQVLMNNINLEVYVGGSEFVKRVKVTLCSSKDYCSSIQGEDSV
jgi:seryl-tRNA(Sec) selenium transferase